MKKLKEKVFKAIANLGYKSAIKATSIAGCYQPKEPFALKNLKK